MEDEPQQVPCFACGEEEHVCFMELVGGQWVCWWCLGEGQTA